MRRKSLYKVAALCLSCIMGLVGVEAQPVQSAQVVCRYGDGKVAADTSLSAESFTVRSPVSLLSTMKMTASTASTGHSSSYVVPSASEVPTGTSVSTLDVPATPQAIGAKADRSMRKPFRQVKGVVLRRYSSHAVRISWKKVKGAKSYRIYVSHHPDKISSFRLVRRTKHLRCLIGGRRLHKTYGFYVTAVPKKKQYKESLPSGIRHIRMKPYQRLTLFAGDSITEGIGMYALPSMHIGGRKGTVAFRGLNTITFHTKRIFHGQTGLQRVISSKPYRLYFMLGLNEIHGRRAGDVIREYSSLVSAIRQGSPNTEMVFCAVSPVTAGQLAQRPGFHQIPQYNRLLKRLAKKKHCEFIDYTDFMKDGSGNLKTTYAAADGYHWKVPAYLHFAKIFQRFDKRLDRQ